MTITYVCSFLHTIWNLCRDWLSRSVPASLAVWLVLLTSIDPMKTSNISRWYHYFHWSQRLPRVWITNTSIRGREELSRTCLSKAQISRHLGIPLADDSARIFLWECTRIWTICTFGRWQHCAGRMGRSWHCSWLYQLCSASPRHPSEMGHSFVWCPWHFQGRDFAIYRIFRLCSAGRSSKGAEPAQFR